MSRDYVSEMLPAQQFKTLLLTAAAAASASCSALSQEIYQNSQNSHQLATKWTKNDSKRPSATMTDNCVTCQVFNKLPHARKSVRIHRMCANNVSNDAIQIFAKHNTVGSMDSCRNNGAIFTCDYTNASCLSNTHNLSMSLLVIIL